MHWQRIFSWDTLNANVCTVVYNEMCKHCNCIGARWFQRIDIFIFVYIGVCIGFDWWIRRCLSLAALHACYEFCLRTCVCVCVYTTQLVDLCMFFFVVGYAVRLSYSFGIWILCLKCERRKKMRDMELRSTQIKTKHTLLNIWIWLNRHTTLMIFSKRTEMMPKKRFFIYTTVGNCFRLWWSTFGRLNKKKIIFKLTMKILSIFFCFFFVSKLEDTQFNRMLTCKAIHH